jgi:hypothetical protein
LNNVASVSSSPRASFFVATLLSRNHRLLIVHLDWWDLCFLRLAVVASSCGAGKWDKLVLAQGWWLDNGKFGVQPQQHRLDASDLDPVQHAECPQSTSHIIKCLQV